MQGNKFQWLNTFYSSLMRGMLESEPLFRALSLLWWLRIQGRACGNGTSTSTSTSMNTMTATIWNGLLYTLAQKQHTTIPPTTRWPELALWLLPNNKLEWSQKSVLSWAWRNVSILSMEAFHVSLNANKVLFVDMSPIIGKQHLLISFKWISRTHIQDL